MDPTRADHDLRAAWFPRTRGDGPELRHAIATDPQVSPHTRGWTPLSGSASRAWAGFPAHAGMDPRTAHRNQRHRRFPRTRGDGPATVRDFRTTTPVSPHTRGWTPRRAHERVRDVGFPAHAGMDPTRLRRRAGPSGFPRTRGDGPAPVGIRANVLKVSPHTRGWTVIEDQRAGAAQGFPAHAGMDRGCTPASLA